MLLHPVKHGPKGNRFCGPSALSAITGKLTDDTAALLRRQTGRRQITGTHPDQIVRALRTYGYEAKQVFGYTYNQMSKPDWKPLTLAGWLKATPRPEGKVFLVDAGNHWQVISGRRYVCGQTKEIVSIRDKRVKRRARVKAAWEIERRAA